MYQRTYQELFNNLYHKTAGLKNFGFYETLLEQPNNSTSYKWTEDNSYNQVLSIPAASFAHEFGTGNVDMTTGDLYWYLHQLTSGHLVSTALCKNYGRLLSKALIMAASMFMIIIYVYTALKRVNKPWFYFQKI